MNRDTRHVLLRVKPPAVGRVEIVLDARGRHADQDDLVPHEARIEFPRQQRGEVDGGELRVAGVEIEQELISTRVDPHVAAVVRLERPDRRPPEPQEARVSGIGLGSDALGAQVQDGQPESEGGKRVRSVVEEEESPADDAAPIDDDVVEADPIRVGDRRRRPDTAAGSLAELHDDDDARIRLENAAQPVRPGRDGHVPIDIDADGARLVAEQDLQRLGQHIVRQRPGPHLLDVALGHGDDHDPRIGGGGQRSQAQVPVVGGELGALERACDAQYEHAEADEQRNEERRGEGRESSTTTHGCAPVTASC